MTFEHVLSLSKLLQLDRLHSCLVHCEYHYFQIMEYLQDSKRRRKTIPGSEGYEWVPSTIIFVASSSGIDSTCISFSIVVLEEDDEGVFLWTRGVYSWQYS